MPPANPPQEVDGPRATGREQAATAPRSGGPLLVLITACTAATAANIYLAAPLLPLIADSFGTTAFDVAWIASVAQFGYAAGLLLFAPLGDRVDRRRLVGGLSLITAAALTAGAAAAGPSALAAAVLVACTATVVPQLLVPLVAARAPAGRRARHVGAVTAGLFTGVVAARVLGGLIGQVYGWRAVFVGAALLTVALGVATAYALPREDRSHRGPLFAGLTSLPSVVRGSPDLWRACVRQAGMYGTWSALWTSLALLLTGPGYGLSTGSAGLFGLFGLSAAAVAPLAGGLVDRFGAAGVVRNAYLLAAVCVPLFWLGGHSLGALFAGAVLIHAALVASNVANQTLALITTTVPATANTACAVASFGGGALASALVGPVYDSWGWDGVCTVAGAWLVLGWLATALPVRRATSSSQSGWP
ncbi:MFS transporter [Streptomyces scopuliridis]|uniref:MFS transporter n=1 Tax=Streptomyces scopuliridis TaxID=452529 RepID=UPI0036957F73